LSQRILGNLYQRVPRAADIDNPSVEVFYKMLRLQVTTPRRLAGARKTLREQLRAQGVDDDHVRTLELVVGELSGAAYDADVESPIVITIETFARLHSVRLRGTRNVGLQHGDMFHLRERILQRLTLAFGERRNNDGTTDLWAEVAR
jgi:hypothetical protein